MILYLVQYHMICEIYASTRGTSLIIIFRYNSIMVFWHYGITALRHYGITAALRHCGITAQNNYGKNYGNAVAILICQINSTTNYSAGPKGAYIMPQPVVIVLGYASYAVTYCNYGNL
ncbi:hypothetical protein C2G38_969486 [Gigaspora rosea]|uniref:Uncharacterized protein n=1 Tax=Gigaspora rosea TaxID=44941 RepID=A0A397W4T4_9GLOM|nr:hypothetical protein C2G38_969486 [Gigaspora rosea]